MNTLDNFKAELESGMANLNKAMEPVMEKFGQAVDVSNLHREMNEHHKRLLALPPNLRSVVCAGIEISLAEKVYAEHGRDLTGQEAWAIKDCLTHTPVLKCEPKLIEFPEIQVAPKRNGIPWNKKQQFNRPIR